MARQNNFYKINSSLNMTAGTATGETRSAVCPDNVTLVRISSTGLVYVAAIAGQGATPTATVAAGVQIDVSAPETFVISPGDAIAVISASGTPIVNVTWLEG